MIFKQLQYNRLYAEQAIPLRCKKKIIPGYDCPNKKNLLRAMHNSVAVAKRMGRSNPQAEVSVAEEASTTEGSDSSGSDSC